MEITRRAFGRDRMAGFDLEDELSKTLQPECAFAQSDNGSSTASPNNSDVDDSSDDVGGQLNDSDDSSDGAESPPSVERKICFLWDADKSERH